MGGWGSGRREKNAITMYVEQCPRLTLARLLAGWGESINGQIVGDRLMINAYHQSWAVELNETRHRWGGQRRWMLCPLCGARCSVLYLRSAPACRQCHELRYHSKTRNASSRMLARWAKSWAAGE